MESWVEKGKLIESLKDDNIATLHPEIGAFNRWSYTLRTYIQISAKYPTNLLLFHNVVILISRSTYLNGIIFKNIIKQYQSTLEA